MSDFASDGRSEIGKRLREWRESKGCSQQEIADALHVGVRTVHNYENGSSSPSADQLLILRSLGADILWLVAGQPTGASQSQSFAAVNVSLPHYDAHLSAGSGFSEPDREETGDLFVSEDFVRRSLRRSPKGLVVARATGGSMAPTILDGDLLVIDTLDQRLQNGRIYAISVDGDLFVKRISKTLRGEVVLRSDNPDAGEPPELISEDIAARVIGQVIWHGGSLE